jgi:hypothetical protein
MTDPCCANCRFGTYLERAAIVVCRRYPPFPVMVSLSETFDPGDTVQGYWPRVSPDDDCGEHRFADGEQ